MMDRVEDGSISQAALHVCAEACRLKYRPELTEDERASVDKAVQLLMAVSNSTEQRAPIRAFHRLSAGVTREERREHQKRGLELSERSCHLSKQSGTWKWNGEDRWWNVFTTINGYNGAGGYVVTDEWRWNNSAETIRTDIRSLSFDESRQLEMEIERLKTEARSTTTSPSGTAHKTEVTG